MEERKTEVDLISEKPEQTGLLKYMLEKGNYPIPCCKAWRGISERTRIFRA